MPQSLVLLNGDQPGVSKTLVPGEEVTIGRHPERDLTVDDDRVSRLHARVKYASGRWHVEDCGSLNGTQVNLQAVQRAVLEPGDLIRVGEQLILFADYPTGYGHAGDNSRTSRMRRLGGRGKDDSVEQSLQRRTPIVGDSPAIRDLLDQISRVGPTDANVLVLGESGSGKELVARVIHELSPRSSQPYLPVNCAAFSEQLLESELFGHEEGAFTGAVKQHVGQFERATGGTLFLDEVGELSLGCQAKLLRVLEGHPFQRVGGSDGLRVDVRIIAATHRDLAELVGRGAFREDLYYRLRVIDLHVPPLRDRGDDVLLLARRLLGQVAQRLGRGPQRLSCEAIVALKRHRWPGNVRELRNCIERAVVLARGAEITPRDLGLDHCDPERDTVGDEDSSPYLSLQDAQRRHIRRVLRQVDGNKSLACRILGIGRGTLYKKLGEPHADVPPEQ
ncbi:MAG: sigma 54-interacting transcriptional regulator [Planctomycetales bacterium]|nr:sigma 54-interacting transcriptional regulator [Planctomycetales bacterium]